MPRTGGRQARRPSAQNRAESGPGSPVPKKGEDRARGLKPERGRIIAQGVRTRSRGVTRALEGWGPKSRGMRQEMQPNKLRASVTGLSRGVEVKRARAKQGKAMEQ